MGLYTEQLSGTSFTQTRNKNLRTWLYKISPTVGHTVHTHIDRKEFSNWISDFESSNDDNLTITPDQIRWTVFPFPDKKEKIDFIHGIFTYCGAGSPGLKNGLSVHLYSCNSSMEENSAFYSADGDLLVVPQHGELFITTELGKINVKPKEIVVLPRGLRFKVDVTEESRGYICEIYKGHFTLPDLGPIGSNGLANARDFEVPVAWYEDKDCEEFKVISKFSGKFFYTTYTHSIFNTVAWWGNYVPYKYELDKFNTIGSISFDHPDPSIFTVLTCPSDEAGYK